MKLTFDASTRRGRLVAAAAVLALVLAAAPAIAGAAVVNVNSADAGQLALLPHVGPATAQRIVDYREKNGPFHAAEDLLLVRGIGDRTFDLIKPYVVLSGATSLTEKVRSRRAATDDQER